MLKAFPILTVLSLVLAGCVPASAQDPAPDPAGGSITEPGQDAKSDPHRQRLDELLAAFEQAQSKYFRPYMEAKTDADRESIVLDPAQDPVPLFVPRFMEFAESHANSAAAVEAWMWVYKGSVRTPRVQEHAAHAVDIIVEKYRDHPALAAPLRFAYYTGGSETTWRLHRSLWEKSKTPEIRAAAGYGLAQLTFSGTGGKATGPDPEARQLLLEVKEKFGSIPFHGDLTYAMKIDGDLFEFEHLAVGKVAPDIIGEDLDGQPMKLSDYRGKVILLDFWGDW